MNRTHWLSLVFLILLLALAGCSALGEEAVDENTAVGDPNIAADAPSSILGIDQPLAGQGVLICNSACSDRAQCGYLNDDDNLPVILVNRAAPAADGHDAFAQQGTLADILEMQPVTMQNNATAEQFQAFFYRIRTPDIESGWVAGWCIQQ